MTAITIKSNLKFEFYSNFMEMFFFLLLGEIFLTFFCKLLFFPKYDLFHSKIIQRNERINQHNFCKQYFIIFCLSWISQDAFLKFVTERKGEEMS